MIKKLTTLAATALACLTLASCVSEGGSYVRQERAYIRVDGPGRHYDGRHDRRDWARRDWDRSRHHVRGDRRDWRADRGDYRGRDGRFVTRDGRRIWVSNR